MTTQANPIEQLSGAFAEAGRLQKRGRLTQENKMRLAKNVEKLMGDWTKGQWSSHLERGEAVGVHRPGRDMFKRLGFGRKRMVSVVTGQDKKSRLQGTPAQRPAQLISLADCKKKRQGIYGTDIKNVVGGRAEFVYEDEELVRLQRLHDRLYGVHALLTVHGPQEYRDDPLGEYGIRSLRIWEEWEDATSEIRAAMAKSNLKPRPRRALVPSGFRRTSRRKSWMP